MKELDIGIAYTMFPDTSMPMVVIGGVSKSGERFFNISSKNDNFFRFSDRGQAAIELRNPVDRVLLNPLTSFHRDSEFNFQIIYGIGGEKPLFAYDPYLGTLIFPEGYFSPNWGIIDGWVDGKYWLMEEPNQWQTFGGRIIRIDKHDTYPKFSLVVGDVLNTEGLVLDKKLLNELVEKYGGSLERLISIYMEGNDQQLNESIAKALRVMEPFSYDLLIATVELPNQEDVEKILNGNDLLQARSLSLRFALRIRLATPEEAETIDNLPLDELPFDE